MNKISRYSNFYVGQPADIIPLKECYLDLSDVEYHDVVRIEHVLEDLVSLKNVIEGYYDNQGLSENFVYKLQHIIEYMDYLKIKIIS